METNTDNSENKTEQPTMDYGIENSIVTSENVGANDIGNRKSTGGTASEEVGTADEDSTGNGADGLQGKEEYIILSCNTTDNTNKELGNNKTNIMFKEINNTGMKCNCEDTEKTDMIEVLLKEDAEKTDIIERLLKENVEFKSKLEDKEKYIMVSCNSADNTNKELGNNKTDIMFKEINSSGIKCSCKDIENTDMIKVLLKEDTEKPT